MTSVAGAVGIIPTLASAQDASNEIIVTANKREQNLNDVGLTVTAIGAEALQNRRVASLEDVASVAPGLIYTPSTNNTPIFTLRGIGFNESSIGVYPAVSVYVDQIPLPFPVMASHSAYDLERIEVLKGPQGTLFGQNSTGGAINYIAAGPTDTFQAGGDISYGRFNAIEGNAYISGPLSDAVGFRLAVNGKNADGWQKAYTRRDTNGKESYVAGRFTLDFEPSDTVNLRFTANGWKDKSDPQAQQLIATHEQIGAGGSKVLTSTPLVDPLRNAYLTPPAGCPSAQMCYPFPTKFNARTAEWGVLLTDPNTSLANAGGISDPALASTTSFEPRGDRDFWQLALRGDFELGSLTLTSLTSYAKFTQDMVIDGDGMELPGFDIQQALGSIKTFNQELRLANDPSSRLRWVVGANYEKSKTMEDQILRYWANSNYYANNLYINHSGIVLKQDIENYAFFGNLEFEVTDRLTLKAAGRYTNSKNRVFNLAYTGPNGNVDKLFNVLGGMSGLSFTPILPSDSYTLNSITIPVPKDVTVHSPVSTGGFLGLGIPGYPLEATLEQDNVSWRFGFDYKATDDVLLYANVSRGFKAGSFPANASSAYTGALPVTQEKVTAYEAGFKAGFADGAVQLNAAGFYMDYRDKQVKGKLFDFVFGTLDTLVNVPKSRIWGAEADITVRPTRGLTISGAVTYLNSKVQDFVGYDIFAGMDNDIDSRPGNFDPTGATPNTEDLSGVRLPYTPKWSGSLNVDYRHELENGGAPFFGFTVSARSNQTAGIGGEDTTLPVTGTNRYRIAPGVGLYPYMIDGYATVDARAGYEAPDGAWKVMVWGKNIFDKYYWTGVIPSSDSSARFAGRPATYGITFGFKFQ
ncbi:TonB-dependent receptor [Tsuneonella sp. CC-YZS046]|uniref:TonB-dependent receptor n=1 Tax=Tsuneonella sp. CC-YZS046 TaxID=3042152 RepID=UPI002D7768E1|nr:TonB-dependent receptor [Tsuneonella sp. CC-YZS046]WRO65248.1 TonB-dependent receptor [Tsuneonella sp. CC-YZS046]